MASQRPNLGRAVVVADAQPDARLCSDGHSYADRRDRDRVIKAGVVILLFMELAKSKALIRLAAMAGVVFLTALFALTLADVLSRLGPS